MIRKTQKSFLKNLARARKNYENLKQNFFDDFWGVLFLSQKFEFWRAHSAARAKIFFGLNFIKCAPATQIFQFFVARTHQERHLIFFFFEKWPKMAPYDRICGRARTI